MLIKKEDQRDLLVYAFRYTLGRATYAPQQVASVLKQCWLDLPQSDRDLYRREIKEAVDRGAAGHKCDELVWMQIANLRDE